MKDIEISSVQTLLCGTKHFAKSEVDDSPFPKELNRVAHIRVIRQPQDIVVGYSCLLLCCNGAERLSFRH